MTVYRVLFGSAETDGLELLPAGVLQRTPEDEVTGYRFIDERILSIGSFTYAVIAVDEADNVSIATQAKLPYLRQAVPEPFYAALTRQRF